MATPKKPNNAPPPCGECGQVHARDGRATCAKHRSRRSPSGAKVPCLQWAIEGLGCCKNHGGSTAAARAKAAERVREAEVAAVAERVRAESLTLGRRIEVADPRLVIMDAIAWCAGHVAFLREQVQALAPHLLTQGPRGVQRTERTGFQPGTQTITDVGPGINLWWSMYCDERDRLHKYCVDATRLGFDEKRIEIEKAHGARIAEAFSWVARAAALQWRLPDEQVAAFRMLLSMALDVLAGEGAFPDPQVVVGELAGRAG